MARIRLFHYVRVHPRLISSVVAATLLFLALPSSLAWSARIIPSLDLGGGLFLTLTWLMMVNATPERMRLRARLQDEGRVTILVLTVGAAVFSIAAIGIELHGVKDQTSPIMVLRLGLAIASIVVSWLVTHTMFALHYAHSFYGDGDGSIQEGGLDFPKSEHPDYWDFLYFAFVIGMTAQTSDVVIGSRSMRRLALAHSVLSFFFNTVILALSINIVAGLL
ncbi:MAG TPA: DUF1345 domain-containing protein [Patescibacteria group bacterium]|nr:DUF1345 domain-containing protein [Patescibacteria group bacterium]